MTFVARPITVIFLFGACVFYLYKLGYREGLVIRASKDRVVKGL
jgi:hypothetical protein